MTLVVTETDNFRSKTIGFVETVLPAAVDSAKEVTYTNFLVTRADRVYRRRNRCFRMVNDVVMVWAVVMVFGKGWGCVWHVGF